MNKILYSPKEGTTGFWGLRDVPDEPVNDVTFSESTWMRIFNKWNDDLESCKSNKLEIVGHIPGIVSGCEVGFMFLEDSGAKIQPGDIFDLPIGYEFKEEELPCRCERDGTCHCFAGKCEGKPKVLRLVKTETKEEWEIIAEKASSIPIKYLEIELVNRFQNDDIHRAIRFIKEVMAIKFDKKQCDSINPNCGFIIDKNGRLYIVSQPEPEESQTEFSNFLFKNLDDYKFMKEGWKEGTHQYETYDLMVREYRKIIDKFLETTIQRKKQ